MTPLTTTYRLARTVSTQDENEYVGADLDAGTKVYRFSGATYGCIGSGVAVTLEPGIGPFFELPWSALVPDETP